MVWHLLLRNWLGNSLRRSLRPFKIFLSKQQHTQRNCVWFSDYKKPPRRFWQWLGLYRTFFIYSSLPTPGKNEAVCVNSARHYIWKEQEMVIDILHTCCCFTQLLAFSLRSLKQFTRLLPLVWWLCHQKFWSWQSFRWMWKKLLDQWSVLKCAVGRSSLILQCNSNWYHPTLKKCWEVDTLGSL